MIVVECTAAVDAIGTTQTLYLSDAPFVTSATDTPAHVAFENRLIDPGDITISIYRDGPSGGASSLEFGEIQFAAIDGEYDQLKGWSFDGRPLVIRVGDGGAYPANFTTIFNGTIASATISWDKVILDIRDKAYLFSLPILTTTYAGTNVGPTGLEGTNDDIGGTLKPMTLGDVQEINPPCVNNSLLIYEVNQGRVSDIPQVTVRGAYQTRGLDYSTTALMALAIVPGGTYITCLNEGRFRIGGTDGTVTCNVKEATGRTAAQCIQFLANRAGLNFNEIAGLDVQALDMKNPAQMGIYINDGSTYIDVMNQFAQSIGAWFAFDNLGVLRMGRLETPSSQPIEVLQLYDIEEGIERTILENEPVPVWSVSINHTKVWTVQTSGLVGTLDPARLAFLAKDYRTITTTKPTVQTQYKLASQLTIDSLLTNQTDATNETTRLLNLHSQPYDVFSVPIDVVRFAELSKKGLYLGKELGLDLDRFNLSGGFSFIVLGISYQRKAKQILLTLWGGNVPAVALPVTVEAIGRATGTGAGFSASIISGAGRATGNGQATSGTSGGIISAAGRANGFGAAQSGSTAVTGTQGQPIGLLLLLTRAT